MNDPTTTIDTYLDAYGERDVARRRELVVASFANGARLIDPPFGAEGHDALVDLFGAVQEQFVGHAFKRTTAVDAHHDTARYGWALVGLDGSVALRGMDVVHFAADGRIGAVTGFIGELEPRG